MSIPALKNSLVRYLVSIGNPLFPPKDETIGRLTHFFMAFAFAHKMPLEAIQEQLDKLSTSTDQVKATPHNIVSSALNTFLKGKVDTFKECSKCDGLGVHSYYDTKLHAIYSYRCDCEFGQTLSKRIPLLPNQIDFTLLKAGSKEHLELFVTK